MNTAGSTRRSRFALGAAVMAELAAFAALPARAGSYQAIYQFRGTPVDGQQPLAGLVMDAQGRLFGTTNTGGTVGIGTVFMLTPPASSQAPWTETMLHSYSVSDGAQPQAPVTIGSDGSLYGTTFGGGAFNLGTVFHMANTAGWPLTILHSFAGNSTDGQAPKAPVLFGYGNLLYGTTALGDYGTYGLGGTDYSVSPLGDSVAYKPIHAFAGGSDGFEPFALTPSTLNEYNGFVGSTASGGVNTVGTVYWLKSRASAVPEVVIYAFRRNKNDVHSPYSPPIIGRGLISGVLYGCALGGGTHEQGGVYSLAQNSGSATRDKVIYNFGDQAHDPAAGPNNQCYLVQGNSAGKLYGITDGGGRLKQGAFFELDPPTVAGGAWTEKVDVDFNQNNAGGYFPVGVPLEIDGKFYGATYKSSTGYGSVYELTP